MNIAGKRLLLIGGAGLIGSHTVDALLKEDVAEIVIFDDFSRGRQDNLVEAFKDPRVTVFPDGGNILQRDILNKAMKGIDGVFHFAALWLLHCYEYPRSAFDVNIGGTFNVLEAMLANNVKRLVSSSSASVYGDAVEEPMTEEHPFNNVTFYGATKIAGEHMCRSLYHRYKNTPQEFSYAGLRYMNVYGERQDYRGAYIAVIMKMLDNIDKGISPVIHGDGSQAYDFVHVSDCGRANVLAMKADATDKFYNVGTGIKTTLKELAEITLELTNPKLKITYEPATVSFVKNRVGSPVKAKADLGFHANVSLKDGLKRLIEWRKSHIEEVAKLRPK